MRRRFQAGLVRTADYTLMRRKLVSTMLPRDGPLRSACCACCVCWGRQPNIALNATPMSPPCAILASRTAKCAVDRLSFVDLGAMNFDNDCARIAKPGGLGLLYEAIDFLGSLLHAVALAAFDCVDEVDRVMRTADVLARRYRWGLSTSWPMTLVTQLGTLTKENPQLAPRAVRDVIVGFYRANGWRELEELVASTCEFESLSPARKRILRDTVKMIRASDGAGYNPATFALPVLLIELEGFARDILLEEHDLRPKYEAARKKNGSLPNAGRFLARQLNAEAERIERHALHLLGKVIFKDFRGRIPRRGVQLSRNLNLHGHARAPRQMSAALRIFLVIDLLAYLVDRRRGVTSERIIRRTLWGGYLSGATERGRTSLAQGLRPSEIIAWQSRPWRRRLPSSTPLPIEASHQPEQLV